MIFLTYTLKTQLRKLKNTNHSLNYALRKKNNGIIKSDNSSTRYRIWLRTVLSGIYKSGAVFTYDEVVHVI